MEASASMMMVRCWEKARVLGYMWCAPGCKGTRRSPSERELPSQAGGVSVAGVLPTPGGNHQVAAPWELTEPWRQNLKMVKFVRVQQKITEAILHCTNNFASLIRRWSSNDIEYCNCENSHTLLLVSPSIKKTHFLCLHQQLLCKW